MSVRHHHRRITSTVLAMRSNTAPSFHAPSFTLETITPEKAAQMLGTMAANRRLRQKIVQKYAREMVAGKWLVNGEAIKVDQAGRLLDGQHRLNAVLMAKIPVTMYVVRGVDSAAMVTLDTGVGRTFEDVGILSGWSYTQAVGPIARWWYKYDSGSPASSTYLATHQELRATLELHPSINESASFIARHKILQSRCVASVQGFVHAYASEKYDREMADAFMIDLNDGASLTKTSPIYHLRKRLVDETNPRHRSMPTHALALTIKAWNQWIEGARVGQLRWANAEDFPRFAIDRPGKKAPRRVGVA